MHCTTVFLPIEKQLRSRILDGAAMMHDQFKASSLSHGTITIMVRVGTRS